MVVKQASKRYRLVQKQIAAACLEHQNTSFNDHICILYFWVRLAPKFLATKKVRPSALDTRILCIALTAAGLLKTLLQLCWLPVGALLLGCFYILYFCIL
jgi:hypothetical protein